MSEEKYNFNIVFSKLEEAKREQDKIYPDDSVISEQIRDEIHTLKEFYDDIYNPEVETYTRT